MIGVLKSGYGNIQSILSLLDRLGYDYTEITSGSEFDGQISHLIIPGVGNYAEGSGLLALNGIKEGINSFYMSGRPILGICLGMQLLTTRGYENGIANGLDIISGETRLLSEVKAMILPHMGWNSVEFLMNHPVIKGIKSGVDFYFAHSFSVQGIAQRNILGISVYEVEFPSIVSEKNVVGVQFHPEKSLKNGIKLIDNFCQWDGKC